MDVVSFLKQHGMYSEDFNLDYELEMFLKEMREALSGENKSMLMIPAYIGGENRPADKNVIALDAGGTNFRVSLVHFDETGKAKIEYLNKIPMPGTKRKLSKDEFFREIAEAMEPVIDDSDNIGFCFSFPADILPNKEGKIISFAKEVAVSEAGGALIGENINIQLEKLGKQKKNIVILNDTVATLLSGMTGDTEKYDGYTGYILGTGMNTAYLEKKENIQKVRVEEDSMIINMESGMYDGFPQGDYDKELDGKSAKPDDHLMEKMISGAYQGELIWRILKGATKEGLFSSDFVEKFDKHPVFTAIDVSEYCDKAENSTIAKLPADENDSRNLWKIVENYFDRAARITAVNFAAILIQTNTGNSKEKPHCITAEGTTFYKSVMFRPMLDKYISSWINEKLGKYCEIKKVEDATIYGSAVAAIQ